MQQFPDKGEDWLQRDGLVVTTTLDFETQGRAETAIEENTEHINSLGANNASLVYLDTKSGDVLAYV